MRIPRLTPTPVVLLAMVALSGCGGSAVVVTSAAPPVTTAAPTPVTAPPATTIPVVTAPPPVTVTVTTQAAPPAPPPGRTLRPGVRVVSPSRYTQDTTLAFRALTLFSNTLRRIDSPSEFRSNLRLLRAELRIFDAAIRRLRSYQLESATLDGQRARLARLGPPLARAMSDFLDAIRDGDVSSARRLANEIQRRLNDFRRAL